MITRFRKHYSWDTEDIKSVHWTIHHGAIQKLRYAGKQFITKFIHQVLPMGAASTTISI